MSSLRNSLHRRNHKERSQLANRKRLGILEKHKDYVLRAKDFNEKKDKIKRLKQKIADRNKDEFYFGMVNNQTKGGVHFQDRGNVPLPVDIVNILKSQDEGYLRTAKTANLKRIDLIKDQLSTLIGLTPQDGESYEDWNTDLGHEDLQTLQDAGLLPVPNPKQSSKSRHTVFVDDDVAMRDYRPPIPRADKEPKQEPEKPVSLGWKPGTSLTIQEAQSKATEVDPGALLDAQSQSLKSREQLLPELRARLERDTYLGYALRELEMQRILMGKGASRKIRGPELIQTDGQPDDELNEDEQDALFGKKRKIQPKRAPDMADYKPRVYKFRQERKR
ncbi:small-subunit processome [Serendipita vermifera]|nr:small-subunit processome [Serendipita vermifera]